ncbi:MAG: squalene/phytoene synthase family protein, partial [Planctomycetota bacterium]|nr:squalene/phytoene synthase family protein [Planctomycetota bacterium]
MTAIEGPTVSEASRYCRRITRRRARNFYYGLKLAPEPQRSALFSIYAWMRRAEDLVDGTTDDTNRPLRNIEAFRCATYAALAGE